MDGWMMGGKEGGLTEQSESNLGARGCVLFCYYGRRMNE